MKIDKFIVLSMEFEFGIWGLCFLGIFVECKNLI